MAAEICNEATPGDDDYLLAADPVLTFLIETTELAKAAIEVTLLVSGMMVSGRLLDELTYIGRLADLLWRTEEAQSEQPPVGRDHAVTMREQIRAFQPRAGSGSDFVHLEQVTIARGTGEAAHAALWRGAVVDVTGWSVG